MTSTETYWSILKSLLDNQKTPRENKYVTICLTINSREPTNIFNSGDITT